MKKLKCWKKQEPNEYNGPMWWKRKDKLDDNTGRYEVTVGLKHHGEYRVFTPTKAITKETQKEAIRVARKYMKEHDSC